jgi:lysophospholipase L1-like esterase
LAVVVLAAAVVLAASPAGAHSAVEPVPRDETSWRDRQALLNQRVAEAGRHAQVIFIGDSLTQRWETEGRDVWARYYSGRHALNLGISGDWTQHVLWRLDNGNLDGLDPRVAVLLIGTNNVGTEATRVAQVADGVTAIVRKLRERLPHTRIVLVAMLPREENPGPLRGNVLQINQIIRRLADEHDVFWLDFGYRFVNADGTISAELIAPAGPGE